MQAWDDVMGEAGALEGLKVAQYRGLLGHRHFDARPRFGIVPRDGHVRPKAVAAISHRRPPQATVLELR